MDKLILGDNQFFGVNHHSRSTGESRAKHFENVDNILALFATAQRLGYGGVMLSSHEKTHSILRAFLKDKTLSSNFTIYPHIPYLMKYVQKVTQKGLPGTALDLALGSQLQHAAAGAIAYAQKDFHRMLKAALRIELSMYRGTKIPAVFLHNGIVDLLLGLGLADVFTTFDRFVREEYGTAPAYGTLNLPKLCAFLKKIGIQKPVIMAPFNCAGFHMNPSLEASEKALTQYDFTLVAMNVLASGAVTSEQAFGYLNRFPQIRHAIIGASSEKNLADCANRWK